MKKNIQLSVLKTLLVLISSFALASCNESLTDVAENAQMTKPATLQKSALLQKYPVSVMYVEVNDNDIREVMNYKLINGQQLFDIAIIFAANINYDTSTRSAHLYFNPQVTNVLNNACGYIKPLQTRGIKVLLSVLGNHQGAGFANFSSQTEAKAFAQELANAVKTYGLDGIDFDDEYAEYGKNGTPSPNSYSFIYLVSALRDLLPDKIISFYNIGPSSYNSSYGGVSLASKIDYTWNPYYGSYSPPSNNISGLTKNQMGAAAVNVVSTPSYVATDLANRTISDDYGVFVWYNLTSNNIASFISGVTNVLYLSSTVYEKKPISGGIVSDQHFDSPYGEDVTKLIDGNAYTKYVTPYSSGYIMYYAYECEVVKSYAIISASDYPDRDPRSWTLEASNDGYNWVEIDNRTEETFASRNLKKTYNIKNPASYLYYRLNVSSVQANDTLQIAEWELWR